MHCTLVYHHQGQAQWQVVNMSSLENLQTSRSSYHNTLEHALLLIGVPHKVSLKLVCEVLTHTVWVELCTTTLA